MQQKKLRVEKFLDEMNKVVPWQELCKGISPYYTNNKNGRQAYDLLLMLKVHFLQLWHNLSDPAMEEAIYDRNSFQKFLGFDCFGGRVPDESSILRFRHLLEKHQLSRKILTIVNAHLSQRNLILKEGTIVDATLLQAPVSKKNVKKERDPEMSSTRKNNKWHFGAKGHIGVQSSGHPIVHNISFSTAKDHDKVHIKKLFHGQERAIFGDSAYGAMDEKRGARHEGLFYGIADKGARSHPLSKSQKKRNRKCSSIRAKVEHPFRIIKDLWGHAKMRYKGLSKNENRFVTLCALSNLYFCRKDLCFTG
jgi:IS5 family transposase